MSDDSDRIIKILEQQAAAGGRIERVEKDIDAVAESRRIMLAEHEKRHKNIDEKIEKFEDGIKARIDGIDKKIFAFEQITTLYRALFFGVVINLAWIVSNIENIKGFFK